VKLLDSLLDAIVRLDGEALVMHVGEKPYVVTTAEAFNQYRGPVAWGQVELSSRVLTPEAVNGMLAQILSGDQRAALVDFGATEFEVAPAHAPAERFRIIAARGGDDIWLEVRRMSRRAPGLASVPSPPPQEPVAGSSSPSTAEQPAAAAPVASPIEPEHHAPAFVEEQPGMSTPTTQPDDESPRAAPAAEAVEDDVVLLNHDAVLPETDSLPPPQDWGDEVMTEGDLGEILRASAVAVITGRDEEAASGDEPAARLVQEPQPVAELRSAIGEPAFFASSDEAQALPWALEELQPVGGEAGRVDESGDQADLSSLFASEFDASIAGGHEAVQAGAAASASPDSAEPLAAPVPIEQPAAASAPEAAIEEQPEEVGAEPPRGPAPVEPESPIHLLEKPQAAARPAAVVVPLGRHTRETPPGDGRTGTDLLERILRLAAARGAATVYLVAQSAPMLRIDGEFSALDGEPALGASAIERLTAELAPRGRDTSSPAEWIIDVSEIGRVRCMAFRDQRGPGLIFRMLPARAISADQLALPAEVQGLCSEADGLVLVAGIRGSGKSTLLTSFVDLINRTRSDHVITIEPQIEFVHENRRSFISQREVRGEAESVAAVRAACREDPDVLVIEDLRTPELVSLALEAVEAGRLIFASVPAASAVATIERIVEMFPPERREKVQWSLAGALRGIVSQVLLRKLRGGRAAAREVLLNTPAVANVILEGKFSQLPAAIESGRRLGMMPFAESLAALVREGVVHPSHAYRKAPNREQFLAILRREGVDASIAERLA
jgi:twitching motility protein PilT